MRIITFPRLFPWRTVWGGVGGVGMVECGCVCDGGVEGGVLVGVWCDVVGV